MTVSGTGRRRGTSKRTRTCSCHAHRGRRAAAFTPPPPAPGDPVLGIEGLRRAGRWYAAGTALDDPEVSPVDADLRGLGRIAAFVGTRALLLAEAGRLQRDAERAGQEIELRRCPGMCHNWIMHPLPDARVTTRTVRRDRRARPGRARPGVGKWRSAYPPSRRPRARSPMNRVIVAVDVTANLAGQLR